MMPLKIFIRFMSQTWLFEMQSISGLLRIGPGMAAQFAQTGVLGKSILLELRCTIGSEAAEGVKCGLPTFRLTPAIRCRLL